MRIREEHERPSVPWWQVLATLLVCWALVVLAHVPVFW
jgi:hypothetical protein